MATPEIPSTMKRLVVTAPGKDVASCQMEVQEVPVPEPEAGQVLIQVKAAAVNPSDYGSWIRCKPEQCPFAMGKEGSGIVVKMGPGSLLSSLTSTVRVGAHVGFVNLKNKQGSYSEYVVATVQTGVFLLPDDLPVEDAASFFVNPYTAIGILDTAQQEGSPAFVHTAAASQLGQMMVKLAASQGVQIINVVRRQEQADTLKALGAEHVVVTGNDEAWKTELKEKIDSLKVTVAFDAVAGSSTGDLLTLLPPKSTVFVYGGLAGKVEQVDPMDLIYREKRILGFFLTAWIKKGGLLQTVPRMLLASRKVNVGLKAGGWSSSQFQDTTLEKAQDDIVALLNSKSTGIKLRVRFE
jgi:NADPH:quinone reductase-like Zn-dependent oxidoreductase